MAESKGDPHQKDPNVPTSTINPRSVGIERRYTGADVSTLGHLRARLIESGHSAQVASGLVGWIVGKATGQADETGPDTRARYRRILEELDGPLTPEELEAPIIFVPGVMSTRRRRRWGRGRVLAGAAA